MSKKNLFAISMILAVLVMALWLSACRSGNEAEQTPTPPAEQVTETATPVPTATPEPTPEPTPEWVSDFTPMEAEDELTLDLDEIYANMPTPEPPKDGEPATTPAPTPTPKLAEAGG